MSLETRSRSQEKYVQTHFLTLIFQGTFLQLTTLSKMSFFKKKFNWRIIALHCVAKLLCFVTFSQFTILCPIQYMHFGPHLPH